QIYKPNFTIVQPIEIPINEYYNILAPLLSKDSGKKWNFPRYPINKQMEVLLRRDSKVINHLPSLSILDNGVTFFPLQPEAPYNYFDEMVKDWEHKANMQAVLSELYGQAIVGESSAQFELGQLYEYGIAVAKNIPQAVIYYQLSASQQDIRAEYN